MAAEGTGLERLSAARAFVDFGPSGPRTTRSLFLLRPERMERYPQACALAATSTPSRSWPRSRPRKDCAAGRSC